MNPLASSIIEGAWPGLMVAGALIVLLPWIDRNTQLRIVPIMVAMLLTGRYAIWRITDTLPDPSETLNFIVGIAFLAIEMLTLFGMMLSFVTLTRVTNRTPEVNARIGWFNRLARKPLVDVFVCTYNEERDILERTILGALAMDYPNFRIWVLDDGKRAWLRAMADAIGVNYLDRPDNSHAKAGNINHGLRTVAALPQPPDFVSILDADFVPTKAFLTRALTLFRDKDVGIVQTPQHFINPDPIQNNLAANDAIPDEQRYFFDVLMPSKDAWGTAFCCGTSSVIRMAALRRIGGMPTDSVTEDYLLTLRMKRDGFRTVYLNERLSLGLAPEGLREYVTQRGRWCLGFMQIIRGPDGPFNLRNGLTFLDRASLVESLLYWTAAFAFRAACLFIPILYLVFGIEALDIDLVSAISHFLPYYAAHLAVMGWLSERRVLPIVSDLAQLLACRDVLKAAFVGLFRPKNRKFNVTAKGGDRTQRLVQWRMMRAFAILLLLTVAGVVVSFTFDPQRSWQDSAAVTLYWSWYNITLLVAAIAVCIERPRFRRNERLNSTDAAWVRVGANWQRFESRDVSVSGIRLAGEAPAPVGTDVLFRVGGATVAGRIVRRFDGEFAIAIEDSLAARAAMVDHVHSGRFDAGIRNISVRVVLTKMVSRVFG